MDAPRVPKISAPALWFFRRIVRGYFRRHFHSVRISRAERLADGGGPLIVYANHSSWWDPMVCILLSEAFLPKRRHFAPMDAQALSRYRVLQQLGIFPVEMKTARGAIQFLRTGDAILQHGGVLWVTPQGRFVDSRDRPLRFKPGLAALARRVAEHCGSCTVVPLAIEYPFWDERLPETLLHVGAAVRVVSEALETDHVERQLVAALETSMEELKRLAFLRDASRFTTVLGGSVGAGGFYAIGQRMKAFAQRRPYRAEHTVGTAEIDVVVK